MANGGAEALRAEIEAVRAELRAEDARSHDCLAQIAAAEERQRLRRELEELRGELRSKQRRNSSNRELRESVDADRAGRFRDSSHPRRLRRIVPNAMQHRSFSGQGSTQFSQGVAQGEYLWQMTGMSWLRDALRVLEDSWDEEDTSYASSACFKVGSTEFQLVYHPDAGRLSHQEFGSLAIRFFRSSGQDEGTCFRYRLYIKGHDGTFVQWGETGHSRVDSYADVAYVGPDVYWSWEGNRSPTFTASGIFGLSYEELLQSEWVNDDVLTVKCALEVRPGFLEAHDLDLDPANLLEPGLSHDMQVLLDKGGSSDVQFIVKEQVIHAHSQVLSARSEVFEKQLAAGMQETMTKVIVIEDCPAATFKAFLKFLYTDQLPSLEELASETSASGATSSDDTSRLDDMQALLAVSHKYQMARLQCWCEAQLSEKLCTSAVCSILSQAHLLQAQQLEKRCLAYIKNHMSKVMKLPSYMEMVQTWPELMLKINLFLTGATEADTAEVLEAHRTPMTADAGDESAVDL